MKEPRLLILQRREIVPVESQTTATDLVCIINNYSSSFLCVTFSHIILASHLSKPLSLAKHAYLSSLRNKAIIFSHNTTHFGLL